MISLVGALKDLVIAQAEGKAITAHPAFEDPGGQPVGTLDLNLGRLAGVNPNSGLSGKGGGGRIKQSSAGRHLEAYGGDQAIDWVMNCARFVGDTVANADFHFEPEGAQDTPEPGDSITAPPGLKKLLEVPNPYMDYIEMMELMIIDLLLVGNAYWFKWKTNAAGQPLALYRLAPPYVEVETKPWGIGSYIYQIPNHDKLEIDPANIIHFKLANPDPKNPFYGVGLLSGAGRAADTELALTDTEASYYENHAMPSVVVESARRIPRDVFRKVKQQLRARMQGSHNAGELLVLEAGLTLGSVAPNAMEAEFAALAKMSRNRIFSWFRINPKLLGISDEGSAAESLPSLQRQFDMKTARPLMNKIQRKLSKQLANAWNVDYVIDYEYQLGPEEQAKLGQVFGPLPGIRVNEIRKIAGLPPLTGKDKEIGEMILNLPGEEGGDGSPGNPTEEGFPDPNLAGEKGRPPNPSNTKAFPKNGKLPVGAKARPAGKAVSEVLAALEALEQVSEGKASTDPGTPSEDALAPRREADVNDASAFLTGELGTAADSLRKHLLLELSEGKALTDSDVVSKLRNSGGWKAFQKNIEEAYAQSVAKVVQSALVHQSDQGTIPADEIDEQAIVDSNIKDIPGVVKTLKDRLANALKEAKGPDATEEDLESALLLALTNWQTSQAASVALTTNTHAYNEGTLAVAESAGKKTVLVSDGTDSDAECAAANGQEWSISKARKNLSEHPRCRRAFVPLETT